MNEFFEQPAVEGQNNRNIIFSHLKWINKSKFLELVKETENSDTNIQPCLNENQSITKRKFLGKSIPKTTDIDFNDVSYKNLEIIGSVFYSNDKNWKLKITYQGLTYELSDEFLILNIEDKNSFFWYSNDLLSNLEVQIPKYALKASFDIIDSQYQFIGKRLINNSNSKNSIVYYSNAWMRIEDECDLNFGKVKNSSKLLLLPYQDLEIGYCQYEILCLKASPASLQVLCRSALRKFLNFSQSNIKSLYRNYNQIIYLPEFLVNYVKYPSFLKIGDFMFKEEKLVDETDKYEVSYDYKSGNLVCKSLEEKQKKNVLLHNVDTILLHPFNVVFFNSTKSKVTKANFIHSNESFLLSYKFDVNWENCCFEIKYF